MTYKEFNPPQTLQSTGIHLKPNKALRAWLLRGEDQSTGSLEREGWGKRFVCLREEREGERKGETGIWGASGDKIMMVLCCTRRGRRGDLCWMWLLLSYGEEDDGNCICYLCSMYCLCY